MFFTNKLTIKIVLSLLFSFLLITQSFRLYFDLKFVLIFLAIVASLPLVTVWLITQTNYG